MIDRVVLNNQIYRHCWRGELRTSKLFISWVTPTFAFLIKNCIINIIFRKQQSSHTIPRSKLVSAVWSMIILGAIWAFPSSCRETSALCFSKNSGTGDSDPFACPYFSLPFIFYKSCRHTKAVMGRRWPLSWPESWNSPKQALYQRCCSMDTKAKSNTLFAIAAGSQKETPETKLQR